MKIVIIGAGAAGVEAAVKSRELLPEAEIALLNNEGVSPYRRPALTGMISAPLADAQFFQKPEKFYAENRIALRNGCAATGIDRAAKKVETTGGTFGYDKLLIAAGAEARTFPIPGAELDNVFRARHFADFEASGKFIAEHRAKNVTIIGGGLLGLEFASGMLERGLKARVVEFSKAVLPNQLDEESAELFSSILATVPNLSAHYGVSATAITEKSVALSDGSEVASDLVVWAVGNLPNTDLASSAGLAVERGIAVDDSMRTSDPDVYAAGDCASVNGRVSGLWIPARDQGRVAARNMCGEEAHYTAGFAAARFAGFGTRLYSAGVFKGEDLELERTVDPASGKSRVLARRNGKLVGAVLVGDVSQAPSLEREIAAN